MSADTDDDIRADFLAEAGELVQRLSAQLVELERTPEDRDLLNAIFRGFHTIKGGAGFLAIDALVALCHAAEDLFNGLRAGSFALSVEMMDAALEAVSLLEGMLAAVAAGKAPTPAPASLVERLHAPGAGKTAAPAPPPPPVVPAAPIPMVTPELSGTISEDEFEALLDQIHGPGKAPGAGARSVVGAEPVPLPPVAEPAAAAASAARSAEPATESSVRVDTRVLDEMMNLVGELVLIRNRLKTLAGRAEQAPHAHSVRELDHVTRSLQGAVMRIRMQPIRKVFSRFPRLAREVARGLGKQVEVVLVGEETGLDKNLVEMLADPLVHMVRNSVDHGIELPAHRLAVGKAAAGELRLAACQAGDHISITVSDDGAGMDPERLRRKAVEKGLMTTADAAHLTAEECLQLVFLPGFSTKEQVSELSGRGVGMDVVKSSISALGGSISIDSKVGRGTSIRMRVPLTLAILPALMVGVGPRTLALPLAPIEDVFTLDASRIHRVDRWEVVLYREDSLRLIRMHEWLGIAGTEDAASQVVVARTDSERYGFVVGQVHGREEVVIKPLGASLRGMAGLAGATVTGEGRVALIADLPGLVRAYSAPG